MCMSGTLRIAKLQQCPKLQCSTTLQMHALVPLPSDTEGVEQACLTLQSLQCSDS